MLVDSVAVANKQNVGNHEGVEFEVEQEKNATANVALRSGQSTGVGAGKLVVFETHKANQYFQMVKNFTLSNHHTTDETSFDKGDLNNLNISESASKDVASVGSGCSMPVATMTSVNTVVAEQPTQGSSASALTLESSQENGEQKEDNYAVQKVEEVIKSLVDVEGFDHESWGSAVNVSNPTEFYPTQLTRQLNEVEYQNFVGSDTENNNEGEHGGANDGSRNAGNLQLNCDNTSIKFEVADIGDETVDLDSTVLIHRTNIDESEVSSVAGVCTNSDNVVRTDQSCPLPLHKASEYLEQNLDDTLSSGITQDYILKLILSPDNTPESDKHNVVNGSISTTSEPLPKINLCQQDEHSQENHVDSEVENEREPEMRDELCNEKLHANMEDNTTLANDEKLIHTEDVMGDAKKVEIPETMECSSREVEIPETMECSSREVEIPETMECSSREVEILDIMDDEIPDIGVDEILDSREADEILEIMEDDKLSSMEDGISASKEDRCQQSFNKVSCNSGTAVVMEKDYNLIKDEHHKVCPNEKSQITNGSSVIGTTVDVRNSISSGDSMSEAEGNANAISLPVSKIDTSSKLQTRSRSASVDCNQSVVSVASSRSSASSIRPCSVVLTRLDSTSSPIRLVSSSVEDINQGNKSVTQTFDVNSNLDDELIPLSALREKIQQERRTEGSHSKEKESFNISKPTLKGRKFKNTHKSDCKIKDAKPVRNSVEINSSHLTTAMPEVKTEPEVELKASTSISPQKSKLPGRKRKVVYTKMVLDVKKEKLEKSDSTSLELPKEVPRKAVKDVFKMSEIDLHKYIKEESEKATPDFKQLSEAMNKTYAKRKTRIYEKSQVELKEIMGCPGLKHYQMVKDEYGRIRDDVNKMKDLESQLEEVCLSALEPKQSKAKKKIMTHKKKHAVWEKVIEFWKQNKSKAVSNPLYQMVPGILVVCFEFAENSVVTNLLKILKKGEKLKKAEGKKMSTPTIVVNESDLLNVEGDADIWIYVDGTKYLKVPNLYEGVLCAFATYYLCNINYDAKLKTMFEFFDMLNGNQQTTYTKSKHIISDSKK